MNLPGLHGSIPAVQMPQAVPSAAAPLSYAGPSPIIDDPAVMHVTANQHTSVKAGAMHTHSSFPYLFQTCF